MSDQSMQYVVPNNSISCFIGRICETPGTSFGDDGILWVDFDDLNNSENGPKHGESGTTQKKAIASWTLRAAYLAWKYPPMIKFKSSKVKLTGRITMSNAQLSNVTLSGGPPLQGTVAHQMGPGTSTTPFTISSASGMAKIEQSQGAEIEMNTNGELDIELTSQKAAQLPWCVKSDGANEDDNPSEGSDFIKAGDFALCMAFGNSFDYLYVVDIFK